jgi:hypothetical protein
MAVGSWHIQEYFTSLALQGQAMQTCHGAVPARVRATTWNATDDDGIHEASLKRNCPAETKTNFHLLDGSDFDESSCYHTIRC